MHVVLDFTNQVDVNAFRDQVELVVKDRSFLLQLAFDLFDCNDDKKISQLDLFKTFNQFKTGPLEERFSEIFFSDACLMSRKLSAFLALKKQ